MYTVMIKWWHNRAAIAVHVAVPVLFSLYPVIFWYAHNASLLTLSQLRLPLLIAVMLAGFMYILLRRILGTDVKASLAAALFVVFFWTFDLMAGAISRMIPIADWIVLLLACAIYAVCIYALHRTHKQDVLEALRNILFVVVCVLLAYNLARLVYAEYRKVSVTLQGWNQYSIPIQGSADKDGPDIYLIILDAYASFHTLEEEFAYDNRAFAAFLEKHGFFVAENSRTRYITTPLCMAALLNLEYPTGPVDKDIMLDLVYNPEVRRGTEAYALYRSYDQEEIFERWQNNDLFASLQAHQYDIHVLEGVSQHYTTLRFPHADKHISYQSIQTAGLRPWAQNHFYDMLLRASILAPFFHRRARDSVDDIHYLGTKYVLDALKKRTDFTNPTFVYAHIMAPHAPYVFDQNGKYVSQSTEALRGRRVNGMVTSEYADVNDAYVNQLRFVTSEIKDVIRHQFKDGSPTNTIFLIMSDHGPRPHELYLEDPSHAFHVLNAIYVPDGAYDSLYADISPVHALRAIYEKKAK